MPAVALGNVGQLAVDLVVSTLNSEQKGDNIPDAFALVNHLNDWLHLLDTLGSECKWKIPTSWNLPFGTGIPPALL
uniref:Proteasome (Prosome, macropain) assembly chaperone 2 n=1 Tax=Nothobranchius furzeri TaxID=105023 RepID=A0A1A8V074_NOTFU